MEIRPTVILTDSSESFLMYLSILLQRMDFEVLPSADGPSLVKLSKAIQPGLIILGPDILDMDAKQVMTALQQEDCHVPVLAIGEDASAERELRDAGCHEFLTKPIDIESLHKVLSDLRATPEGQRQHLRVNFHSQLTLAKDEQVIKCQGITLSEGGIFIRRKCPFPQGSRLQIELPLGKEGVLFLDGEVIYTKQLSKDQFNSPPGMAVRFMNLIDDDRDMLKTHIKYLLAGDLLEEQDEPILMG